MLSSKIQDIYLKLQIPPTALKGDVEIIARVFGQGEPGQVCEDQTSLAFQSADQKEVGTAPENKELMERYSVVDLAESAAEALKLEKKG